MQEKPMSITPNTPKDWIDLTGKVAHITGAGNGIGAAIAQALAMAGAQVMVSDIKLADAEASAAKINEAGRQAGTVAKAMALDVSNREDVDAAISETAATLGSLDILANNAGLYNGFGGPVRDITDEKWRALWSVNVDGVFYCCRAAASAMVEAGNGGRIINISSTQAMTPGVGVTYDGSKAAVLQITKALALELAPHNINVNALAPGPTWVQDGAPPPLSAGLAGARTVEASESKQPLADAVSNRIARLPKGHWGDPMEQGKAAVFLASEMSSFVTGIYLPVDGGWLVL